MKRKRKETTTYTGLKHFEENYRSTRIYNPSCMDLFLSDAMFGIGTVQTKKVTYDNVACSFDIETSSFYDYQGEKSAIMYEWTFGLNGFVLIGRTWEQFTAFYNMLCDYLALSPDLRLICYVHNLSYEFQFIRKRFEWAKVFAVDTRKPVYAITKEGLEFRCSYLQSGYNLANLGKNLHKYHCEKMVGDLDYKKLRNSETPLTGAEIRYCVNDVKVVMCYITEQIEIEGDISKIPLTKTGYVRRYVRGLCFGADIQDAKKRRYKRYDYSKMISGLTIEPEEYIMLKQTFQGGFTHASPFFSGETESDVTSMDFTSSYPAQMIKQKYPMSKGEKYQIKDKADFLHCLECYCCMFDVEITGLQSKFLFDDYISESRCRKLQKPVVDNGRLVSADYLITTITEQDFAIICQCYTWKQLRIGTMYRYYKRYLPHDFVRAVLELYKQKTTLKGVAGEEVNYMLYKGMLNSCYGMAVTDIVRDILDYDEDWIQESPNLEEALEAYNKSRSRFSAYPWGVWVTAYARRALWSGIFELKEDYIYSDTDSVKYIHPEKHQEYFERYNRENIKALEKAMYYHGFDKAEIRPKTIKGVEKPIGVWDFDGHYNRFKALRAKCYMVENDLGEVNITVSGLNKKITVPYLKSLVGDPFKHFNDGLYVPAEYTGKNTHTYIDEPRRGQLTDYTGHTADYEEFTCVHLEETDYSLSLADSYVNYLMKIKIVNK